jgi:bifunctional non-homologous end joining protein LigD
MVARLVPWPAAPTGPLCYRRTRALGGEVVFEHVCRMGLEGIVSKRADAPYRSGPSKMWLI